MAGQESEEIKPRSMVTTTGYWYSDHTSTPSNNIPNLVNHQLQSFETNPEIYNLTSGMEMIGFPSNNPQVMWKGNFFNKNSGNSSVGPSSSNSKSTNEQFYQHGNFTTSENMLVSPTEDQGWNENNRLLVDDPSLRCVFPCEGNERPSQGLSLSLCSSNPSSIGLQSFELRHQQQILQDGFLGKAAANIQGYYHQIKDSKYLGPAQELLVEFCSLGTKQNDHSTKVLKQQKSNQWEDENASSSKKQTLQSLDLLELQKRKSKLLQMLEEVDRRYKHYCDQMKAVVSTFEAVAGNGAARVYSTLASKAMSRHFRCLRDGIVGQIKATKKAMGEKDSVIVPGTTRGETPRLRLLDQTLRQQKAFQQMNMMETHPWRPQRGLPERSVSVLRAWLFEHFLHPYPSDVDKHILARQTGLSRSQVSNWFINARVRLWKPMVEEMYLEETKDQQENLESPEGSKGLDHDMNGISVARQINQNPHHLHIEDQKPNLVRIDSEYISSIINHPEKNDTNNNNKNCLQDQHQVHNLHSFGRGGDHSFGAIELDFSSYNHNSTGAIAYGNENVQHNIGGGVSLTLGLNQNDGSGMGLSTFSQASQSSLFYPRDDHIDQDCQQVQYSLLDSENQNLPYRNLMGAQLLHDLAG
ncbi:PREDICTED: homeobox protein BEL1 homolog [Nicotiana attenuata]|uniref:Homeobox protein bel1-like protein n=1 Tax=Nicotiana attenuata TaxID=49451 RepID=A0A1J6IAZ3_NICAT|nr:PREDICTED: homeobox protein BEL1 homolog [Nicotiana attenuata]XP_019246987.1 PREDICTED: homeobox protein BEL1 homolog [Nicotiana attenuata]OIT01746.1 homeobox protein bel1-like protein [Nicotiana attenuata]